MVTADIVDLGALNEAPDLGLLEVVQVVVVRGAQVGAETPVVAGDDDAAAAGGLGGLDAVLDTEAGLLDGVLEDGGVLVVADTAQVDDAVVGQDVLGSAGGVLGGAAGDELGLEVVQQVLVEGLVLVLGQDGVVGLEAVLGEELIVAIGLDVCWGVGKAVSAGESSSTRKPCPRADGGGQGGVEELEARAQQPRYAYRGEGSPGTRDGIAWRRPFCSIDLLWRWLRGNVSVSVMAGLRSKKCFEERRSGGGVKSNPCRHFGLRSPAGS